MNIMFVSRGIPSLKNPLLGVFEWDQAKAVKNEGENVIFISLDLRSIRRWRKWGLVTFVKDGIKVYSLSFPIGAVPAWIICFLGKFLLDWLYGIIIKNEGNIDVVHAHFTEMGAISSVLKQKYQIPLVVTEHSSALNKDTISKYSRYLADIAYKTADRLIAVSNPLAMNIMKHFNVTAKVIPNIVNVTDINCDPINHESFIFTSIGRLIYGKGFDLLIEAFKTFKDENVKLQIIGDGPLKSELQKLIDDNSLGEQIFLLGYKNRKEISNLLNRSDAFVLASRGETFGVVYIEAMLAGLPVVATRCGGPEDFVNKNNGILIPKEDKILLSEALLYMKNNILRYNKKDINKLCKQFYSPQCVANQLINEYKSWTYKD